MRIKVDHTAYSSHFHNVLYSWDRYIVAFGGRGSGKTDTFYLKYLLALFEPYYFRLAYVNKEKSNIRDSQYAGFKRVAKRIGIYHLLKFYDGDYRVVNPSNGNALIPKGMDDPEKTKGFDDITAIWWDEVNKGSEEDFETLNALLRSPKAQYLQFAISFNPVSEKHWLRKYFFNDDSGYELHPSFVGKALLNHSTYQNNEFINQQEYYETLVMRASGNSNRLRVDVKGEWGQEDNKNTWLYAWDENRHVSDAVIFRPTFPIVLAFDFNTDPFTCTAWQKSPNMAAANPFVHCINEFGGKFRMPEMCQRIKITYPASIFTITGDMSGNKDDIAYNSAHDVAYNLIQKYLNVSNKQMQQNRSNLEHENSWYLCNGLFHHLPDLKISPKCVNLIDDCRNAKIDEKSNKAHHLKKDRGDNKMDYFDTKRYFFQSQLYEFAKTRFMSIKP